ncbi:MAG TPA: FAD/NAD(P)-binding protein [Sphingomicrobium sp.]|nr:FAD/NAD(P)-binding protein [Sphingomicrobium sp.]
MNSQTRFPVPRRLPVAIVGGGYSGTILSAKLARRGIPSFLIDGSGRTGRGHAYSTLDPAHLLNVRADRMSAFADAPDHFADAYEEAGGDRRGFAPRSFYGEYLGTILDQATVEGGVIPVNSDALTARKIDGRWQVGLSDGGVVEAELLVLAVGNQKPDSLPALAAAEECVIADPWGPDAREAISRAAEDDLPVLLIGTGLTMVDAVLSLDAAGHSGRIVAVSRRGQVPFAHADFVPAPIGSEELPLGSLMGMWRWLRRRSEEVGWHAAVDSLRPHSQHIWKSWDLSQKRRFLRHARPWWDVRRHRTAPEAAAILNDRIAASDLEIVAGRIGSAQCSDAGLDTEIRMRGTGISRFDHFAFAINCTGPLHAIARTRSPLLRDMLGQGLIRPDAHGIGAELDEGGEIVGANDLFAIGPLTKGRYWEITAVPDIREQASAIADTIAKRLAE